MLDGITNQVCTHIYKSSSWSMLIHIPYYPVFRKFDIFSKYGFWNHEPSLHSQLQVFILVHVDPYTLLPCIQVHALKYETYHFCKFLKV